MDLIVEKGGIKWILENVCFTEEGLKYEKAVPFELKALLEEKEEIENLLSNLPSDEELLEWAKENHPQMIESKRLQERLLEIEDKISELEGLSFEE
ncbi:MAG TPA: hypothetical protein ENF94_00085 [Candidatus Woesearchaeota archaeon]|nr:hypothetical protein [Candidatus Woesearchaeota archaeon]